jgi:hypothetical protein
MLLGLRAVYQLIIIVYLATCILPTVAPVVVVAQFIYNYMDMVPAGGVPAAAPEGGAL